MGAFSVWAPSQCLSARAMGRHNNQKESCAQRPSLVPLAIYSIRQSFLQVIASEATEHVVAALTRILLNDFDRRYHPTTNGKLKYEREALVGHGNRYISIHPYFFKAAFLDPRTHHFLRNIMEADNFHEVC